MQHLPKIFLLSVVGFTGPWVFACPSLHLEQQEIVIEKNPDLFTEDEVVVIKLTKSGLFVNDNPVASDFEAKEVRVRVLTKARHTHADQANPSYLFKPGMFSSQIEIPSEDKPCLGIIASGTEKSDGVIARIVLPNSAAEKAGLKRGDKIFQVNHRNIHTEKDLLVAVMLLKENDTATVGYTRMGSGVRYTKAIIKKWEHNWTGGDSTVKKIMEQKMKAHLSNWSEDNESHLYEKNRKERPKLGIEVEEVRLQKEALISGFKVVSINPDSYAQECGIKVGDVIIQIGDKKISGKTFPEALEDWKAIQKSLESSISLEVLRRRKSKQILISFHPKRVSI